MTFFFHVPRLSQSTRTMPPSTLLRVIPTHIPVVPNPNG